MDSMDSIKATYFQECDELLGELERGLTPVIRAGGATALLALLTNPVPVMIGTDCADHDQGDPRHGRRDPKADPTFSRPGCRAKCNRGQCGNCNTCRTFHSKLLTR